VPPLSAAAGAAVSGTAATADALSPVVLAALAALVALALAGLILRQTRSRAPLAAGAVSAPASAPAVAAVALPPPPTARGRAGDNEVTDVPPDAEDVVRRALAALEAHDVSTAAELVHPDVVWPSAVSTDTIRGREEFCDYWSGRLATVDVQCQPVQFERVNGMLLVDVHEVVRDRSGKISYGQFRARREFFFRDGLIAEMRRRRWSV
jgi:hypothetical protein